MAIGAGAVGALAFPEPGWWWLAPLFPVPILLVCRAAGGPWEAARHGWLAGTAFFVAAHHWALPSVTVFVLPLGLLLGGLWAPVGALAWATLRPPLTGARLAAGLGLVPAAWVTAELIRSWDRLGGPWVVLGASQWNNRPLLDLAAVGGVWLISLVLVAVAVALTAALAGEAAPRLRLAAAATGVGLLGAAVAVGALRSPPTVVDTVRVGGVQPGVIRDPDDRFAAGESATRALIGEGVELVVWGESSVGFDPDDRPDDLARLVALAGDLGAPVLANVDRRQGSGGVFKSSLLVDPDGNVSRYDKTRLVPFGEYIPMRRLLGWITAVTTAAEADRRRGDRLVLLTAPREGAGDIRLGPLICFESAFPDLAREHAAAGADLIVLQTATTTVEGTWAQAQHASLAAVRAVETGRPVLHAALSGVSAAFDANGRRLTWFEGVGPFTVDVPIVEGSTPYVRFGDWVAYASAGALVLTAVVVAVRRRRPTRQAAPV